MNNNKYLILILQIAFKWVILPLLIINLIWLMALHLECNNNNLQSSNNNHFLEDSKTTQNFHNLALMCLIIQAIIFNSIINIFNNLHLKADIINRMLINPQLQKVFFCVFFSFLKRFFGILLKFLILSTYALFC